MLVDVWFAEALGVFQHPGKDAFVRYLRNPGHTMLTNMLGKRLLRDRDAIHQARTAHKFATGLALSKMDPATSLCRTATNLPSLFSSDYLV